jgi:hypothetical protein
MADGGLVFFMSVLLGFAPLNITLLLVQINFWKKAQVTINENNSELFQSHQRSRVLVHLI